MDYIATREPQAIIQELRDAGKHVYSISKLNTIADCEYEAGLTYKQHKHGEDGVYGIMGTTVHDTLEAIMNDRATEADLLPAMKSELAELEMLGIEFPKDRKGEDSIRDRWVADMTDFCTTFVRPKGNFTTEEFFCYPLTTIDDEGNEVESEDRWLQGYIDLIQHNRDGSVSVWDWKTSSKFNTADLIHHGRQLVGYTIAMEKQGYYVSRAGWIMLKYASVTFMGLARANAKQETEIKKVVQRSKIVSELKSHLERSMLLAGYDELTTELTLAKDSWKEIPEDVRRQYTVKPFVWEYPITEETKREFWNYCNEMADRFEAMSDDENDWSHRDFYKVSKAGKKNEDTFRCVVLCNHRKTCKPLQEYFEMKDAAPTANDEWDLF